MLDSLAFSGTSHAWIGGTPDMSTEERDWIKHQERRACRQVNSTGPMQLSDNSFYRMASAEAHSPLVALSLTFTPKARTSQANYMRTMYSSER